MFCQLSDLAIFLHVSQLISRKDKTTFDKLDYLTSKEENYTRMREYIRSLKMVPCIPYFGESSCLVSLLCWSLCPRHESLSGQFPNTVVLSPVHVSKGFLFHRSPAFGFCRNTLDGFTVLWDLVFQIVLVP